MLPCFLVAFFILAKVVVPFLVASYPSSYHVIPYKALSKSRCGHFSRAFDSSCSRCPHLVSLVTCWGGQHEDHVHMMQLPGLSLLILVSFLHAACGF